MHLGDFNSFCQSLPHTAHVVQWGGAHVWKVGGATGKMFAICWPDKTPHLITFKCSEMSFDLLKEQAGLRPAPYLASRGMKWIQWFDDSTLDEAALRDYLRASYTMAAANLPKSVQKSLGFQGA